MNSGDLIMSKYIAILNWSHATIGKLDERDAKSLTARSSRSAPANRTFIEKT
jgi:hypothetical protein